MRVCVVHHADAVGPHVDPQRPLSALGRQQADGSWAGEFGEVTPQATAMALIVLQVPLRFLPILER